MRTHDEPQDRTTYPDTLLCSAPSVSKSGKSVAKVCVGLKEQSGRLVGGCAARTKMAAITIVEKSLFSMRSSPQQAKNDRRVDSGDQNAGACGAERSAGRWLRDLHQDSHNEASWKKIASDADPRMDK